LLLLGEQSIRQDRQCQAKADCAVGEKVHHRKFSVFEYLTTTMSRATTTRQNEPGASRRRLDERNATSMVQRERWP
jgi:hypothetical protein